MQIGDLVRFKKGFESHCKINSGVITAKLGIIKRRIGIANFRSAECVSVLIDGTVRTIFVDMLEIIK